MKYYTLNNFFGSSINMFEAILKWKKLLCISVLCILGLSNIFAIDVIKFVELQGVEDTKYLMYLAKEYEKDKDNRTNIVALGFVYYTLALRTNGYSEKAFEYLGQAVKLYPKNYVIMAYYGSAKGLIGRDAENPIDKIDFVKESINILNKAIENDPENVYVRLIRANTFFSFPDFFGVGQIAEEDFRYLLSKYEEMQKKGKKPEWEGIMSNVYYNLGEIEKKKKNLKKAMEYWGKAYKIAPESVDGKKAKEQIEKYGE